MALFTNRKEISAIQLGRTIIAAVYRGARLLWQAINSCYGSGHWERERVWKSDDAWRNQ